MLPKGKTARPPLAPRTELNLRLAANPEGSPLREPASGKTNAWPRFGQDQNMNPSHPAPLFDRVSPPGAWLKPARSTSVKPSKTKFTDSWPNHAFSKPLQINQRPDWVKPSQTDPSAGHEPTTRQLAWTRQLHPSHPEK
jgi:hypothetical protein